MHKVTLNWKVFTLERHITYVPVSGFEAIRILLIYAYANKIKLYQIDVNIAFFNGLVYVEIPPDFEECNKPNHMYKPKALYRLNQAPRA